MDERSMAKAAVLYYHHDMTHEEVGQALGWSRVKTTRALKEARARGLVEFVIRDAVAPFEHLERILRDRYGLTSCRVGPAFDDRGRTTSSVAKVGAESLREFLPETGTVAVAMSTTLSEIVETLGDLPRPELQVASVTGSVMRASADTSSALAFDLARHVHGSAYTVPGPLRAAPEVARVLRADPAITAALELAASATHLVVGIGSMEPGGGRMRDSLGAGHLDELEQAGAVGDVATRFFDVDGAPVPSGLDDELLALEFEQLTAVPQVFAVAVGAGKSTAVEALLRRHFITDLVVDAELARALLETGR